VRSVLTFRTHSLGELQDGADRDPDAICVFVRQGEPSVAEDGVHLVDFSENTQMVSLGETVLV
jgi:hypothetical protein